MAIAKMRHLRLIGLKADENKIMHALLHSGRFEVAPTSLEGSRTSDRSHLDKAVAKQAKVAFAVDYLYACAETYWAQKTEAEKKHAEYRRAPVEEKPRKGGRVRMGYDDFYDVAAKEYELLAVCDELQRRSFRRLECASEISKLQTQIKAYAPYAPFPLSLDALGTGTNASVSLWYASSEVKALDFGAMPVFAERYVGGRGSLYGIVCRTCDREAVASRMANYGFGSCGFTDEITASERIAELSERVAAAEKESEDALYASLEYYKYLSDLRALYDVIGQDIETSTARLDFTETANTFIVEGWIPATEEQAVLGAVKAKTERIYTELRDPTEDETPPTLIVSKTIFKPYEDVTNMYSVPAYHEIDPNPFMAVFFFLFFGIMIGDAGYGLILSLGGLLVLKFVHFEKPTARLIALMAMGGVSAILWGVLFGGIFAIQGIPPLWFNPMDEPMMMLGVSIALGAVQLLTGYALHSAKKFREGKIADGILDSIFIFLLFGGIVCLAIKLLLKTGAVVTYIGMGLLIAAMVGILTTAGRHNKGVASKIMGGFSGLYGLVNLLSDLLSYARLFGLGLASGAIGLAFNTLGEQFFSIPYVGYVIGIILLIPLHAFNIGIGVLGAYVHNARLQFLEFYGKFYEGDGRLFSPMGEKTKYVRFE